MSGGTGPGRCFFIAIARLAKGGIAEEAAGRLVQLLPQLQIVHPAVGGEGIFAIYQKSDYQPGKLRSFLAFLSSVLADQDDMADQTI